MRRFAFVASLLAVAACGQPQAPDSPPSASAPSGEIAPPVAVQGASKIEGWETDITDYALAGSTLPAFSAKRPDGSEMTEDALRDRWTIVGFIGEPGGGATEATYASSIVSAADQDPALDILWALTTPSAQGGVTNTSPSIDGAELAKTLQISDTPAYLLIGPDLTIEGHRGPLSTSTDGGIKSVIRGVAEIRKQIASPE